MSEHPREAALLAALDALGIAWKRHEHMAVFTVEESLAIHDELPGAHTKNLFLKDAGGAYWLLTVPHDCSVDLKAAAALLGAKKFSFAKPEPLEELLALQPGSVTPLGAFNDAAGLVRVVIDRALAEAETVNVHPLRNTATLALSGGDLLRALTAWGHDPLVADLPRRG